MWWEGGCWTTISPLSCSGGTGDRGEGWLQARETGASRVGAPQPALPLHQILLSLLAACPSLVCTPQLQSWPAPSLPREAQDKQAREKKGGGFEGRNYPSVLSPPPRTHTPSLLCLLSDTRDFGEASSHPPLSRPTRPSSHHSSPKARTVWEPPTQEPGLPGHKKMLPHPSHA